MTGQQGQINGLATFSQDDLQNRIGDMQRNGFTNGDIAGTLSNVMQTGTFASSAQAAQVAADPAAVAPAAVVVDLVVAAVAEADLAVAEDVAAVVDLPAAVASAAASADSADRTPTRGMAHHYTRLGQRAQCYATFVHRNFHRKASSRIATL